MDRDSQEILTFNCDVLKNYHLLYSRIYEKCVCICMCVFTYEYIDVSM